VRKLNGYDYAIIDTPPYFGILTMNALVACSALVVPIQAEYYAMRGMTQLLQVVDMVEERMEVSIKRRYLLTMYDSRTKLSRDVVEQVREHLKDAVFKTVIPRNVRLAESPPLERLLASTIPIRRVRAIAYKQLAEEVIEWLEA
jgi:chromosome partitioning protein